jgi:hypothetical protein
MNFSGNANDRTIQIPSVDLKAPYSAIEEEVIEAVRVVCRVRSLEAPLILAPGVLLGRTSSYFMTLCWDQEPCWAPARRSAYKRGWVQKL